MFEVELIDLRDKKAMWVQTENAVGITSRIPMASEVSVGNTEREVGVWNFEFGT